ncbi:MAG: MopE-related protein [Deltaproteobacteria bacterium]|nr:MopE-related protein [Myxococcales bacterium]MDP3218151.1 MopE-related protein [Deltaproteobacteria bacterium]
MYPDRRDRTPRRSLLALAAALTMVGACARATEGSLDGDDAMVTDDDARVTDDDAGEEPDVGAADVGFDVGALDTGPRDAGVPDTGARDVGVPDAGFDAGPRDVGVPDTGVRDVGVVDAGPRDTGVRDVGVVDTGPRDTGVRDVGVVDTGPPVECAAGASRFCYTGPAATRLVGTCADGVEQCAAGRWSGRCEGERTPAAETCNNLDDDCDRRVDDLAASTCYSGPTATRAVGACRAGTRTCTAGTWSTCAGEVLPAAAEVCGNAVDEDCNGSVDDGCAGASRFAQGNVHACWLDDSARAWCWGGNFYGQTTFTTTGGSPSPVRAPSFDGLALAAGEYFGCVIRSDRTLHCAGLNDSGQIGDGSTTDRMDTVPVVGLTGVTAVAAGYKHACAVVAGGAVRCWGLNDRRQLGATCTGTDCNARPLAVAGLSGVTQLALGNRHSCALRSDGTVACWGDNANGELGLGTVGTAMAAPATVPGLSGVRAIEAGISHTCALLGDGTVRCWGANTYGQVGDGTMVDQGSPRAVIGLRGVERLVVGMHHGCALAAGRVSCWGYNSNGQLGDGTTVSRATPLMTSLVGITDLGAGYWHTCARSTGTTVWCWGWNLAGMLGIGATTPAQSTTPLRVAF